MESQLLCATAFVSELNGEAKLSSQKFEHIKAEVKNLDFHYGSVHAVKNVNLTIPDKKVVALIGPSGCGKTTLLRCFNRMHDLYDNHDYKGETSHAK